MSDAHLQIGDPKRPYIQDAIDEAAAKLYARRGFNPPERPTGFLDQAERDQWERWRQMALQPTAPATPHSAAGERG